MDSRERLDALFTELCQCIAETLTEGRPAPTVDLILSSDWLRDTLAAERRAGFIAGRDAAAKVAHTAECNPHTGNHMRATILHRIRNLEPEASDEARG